MDDQEEKENIIQYIIVINISYLADQGVPEYFHKQLDKYRKQTLDVIIDKYKKERLQPRPSCWRPPFGENMSPSLKL